VAVAHTADDQVETILLNLLRGAGLAGLKGMLYRTLPTPWSHEIPLVRPLLGIWRTEVLDYVLGRGYKPVFDASNLDVTYARNRLRHELIPMLEAYHPGVRHRLWQTGEVLREDYLYIREQANLAWETCVLSTGASGVVLARPLCLAQPKAVQRYLLKMGIESLRPGVRNLDFQILEKAQRFMAQPTRTGKLELSDSLMLSLHGERLILYAAGCDPLAESLPRITQEGRLALEPPGELSLDGVWAIHSALIPNSASLWEQIRGNADPYQAWLNADQLIFPLTVRKRAPGDRFAPLGMGGDLMKLSDLMINLKLPENARRDFPLVCGRCSVEGDESILWVPGYRQSEFCRVTEETRQIVWLTLKGENSPSR
jgi:tRNA(Ile)-lysidine synthase